MFNHLLRKWKTIWNDESGMGVVEVILIIIVLIGLVLIFKDNLSDLVDSLFETMTENAGDV
ncbi:MAG: hypothetical protein IAC13_05350 [Firmicutes bacterium]|uniref:Putative Flagellin Flp1-like domain-containing protein n=1 Tax=Candidatus Scybalomonas excrementavium TaxID=2840943 RepID=A0A9D9HZT0_9FIRM|nr:hypothetical protein [Candidatus Scybalomonas excrementavium]